MEKANKLKGRPKFKKIKVTEDKRLRLSWEKVEGAEKYGVYRKEAIDDNFRLVKWAKKSAYTDTVEQDKTYWYKITAMKKLEGKKKATKSSGVKTAIVSDIEPVENLSAVAEKNFIKLSWDKQKGAGGYIVSRRNDFFSQFIPIAVVKGSSFKDKTAISGQPYRYVVQALVEDGERKRQGKFTKPVYCVCLDSGEILEAKASGKKVHFSLRLVAGADGYIIERKDNPEGEYVQVAKTSSNLEMTLTDKAPAHFKTYYYRALSYKTVKDKVFYSEPTENIIVKTR